MYNFISNLVSRVFTIHDGYSTIVGSTQPIFDRIADSIQKISMSIWNSKPMDITSKAIVGTINQSRLIQNGLQKTVNVLTSDNSFSFQIKTHLLTQDPKIKRLKNKINDLENKIQSSYSKVFKKPILMEKMEFSIEEYQVIARHFQKFLAENHYGEHTDFFSTICIENIIDFIENDTIPDSQLIKEELITSIENLSPVFTQSSESPENEIIIEAKQAFQNCYFLFLSKELLRKFEKGEIYKDDLVVFLKNYKTSPITSLIKDATIENIGEVCAGMMGEVITGSSLAASLHRQVDKRVLGPILSISPLHSLLGTFSSYLGITLASYIGIKALGSEESLKDYVHNMTWAMIASMITEYSLEMSEISNPAFTFLIPLIGSSIAYNFSSLYKPLLKTEYFAKTISESYSSITQDTDKLLENACIEPIRQKIFNTPNSELRKFIEKTIIANRIDVSLDQISYTHRNFNWIPSIYENKDFLINFITNHMDNLFAKDSGQIFKDLLLKSLDLEKTKEISNTIVKKSLTIFFGEFSKFYSDLINNKTLLKNFYARRLEIIKASSNLSDNSDLSGMPGTQDILLELVCAINPLHRNSLELSFLFAKVDELFSISLFQSLFKNLEESLESKIHPFSNMDPLFLELLVKSFIITTLLKKKDLPIQIINADVLIFQNTLKLIDCLIHLNLVGQYNTKQQPLMGNIIYKLIHQEMNTAIQSVSELIEESA